MVKKLNPEVVGDVGVGQAQPEARVVLDFFLVDARDVERRIGHHEVELADAVVDILVISVALADVPDNPWTARFILHSRMVSATRS